MHRHRLLASFLMSSLLSVAAASAQDYYVDPVNGSDFNDGLTTGTAFRTVNFALNGGHGPLKNGTTVFLMAGTYDVVSGQSFPWVIYNDISLHAHPMGTPGSHVVDSGPQVGVEFAPNRTISEDSVVKELTIRGDTAVWIHPDANVRQSPVVEDCFIDQVRCGIQIDAQATSEVAPTIRRNSITATQYGVFLDYSGASFAAPVIQDNATISGDEHAVRMAGGALVGTSLIEGNTLTTSGFRSCVYFDNVTAVVDLVRNQVSKSGSQSGRGVYLFNCSGWNARSRIYDNSVNGFSEGIYLNWNTRDARLIENEIVGCRYGIHVLSIDGSLQVAGNEILGSGGLDGIYARGGFAAIGENATITDNMVSGYGGTGAGIRINSCSSLDVEVSRNTVNGNGYGIWADRADSLDIQRNIIRDSQQVGLQLTDCEDALVARNRVENNLGDGLIDVHCHGTTYSSNVFALNQGVGLVLQATSTTDPPLIVGNTFASNTSYGLSSSLPSTIPTYVANSIFWANNGIGNDFLGLAVGQYCHCVVETGASPGCGVTNQNPQLNPVDFSLTAASASAIDAGDDTYVLRAAEISDQPRILDGDWSGKARVDIGADEYSETMLDLTGTFQAGTTVVANVRTLPGNRVELYAAVASSSAPINGALGMIDPRFGSVLLQTGQLYSRKSIAKSTANGVGAADLNVKLPAGGSGVGTWVALEALAIDPNTGAGQLSEAGVFQIQP